MHGIGDRYRGRESEREREKEERNPESKISGLPYEQMREWTDGWTTVIPRGFRSPAFAKQRDYARLARAFGVLDTSWRCALGQARNLMLQGRRRKRGRKREREEGGSGE